jgi:hypothetical protein
VKTDRSQPMTLFKTDREPAITRRSCKAISSIARLHSLRLQHCSVLGFSLGCATRSIRFSPFGPVTIQT